MFLKKDADVFLTVAQFANLSKAADYLGVQQSSLSKSIKRLEHELKKPLFIRKARGLELTEVGHLYRDSLLKINQLEDQFFQNIATLNNEIVGNFKLGAHPVIAKFIIPKIKANLEKYPSLKLNFDFLTSRECTEKVLQNELDLAIVAQPINYPDLVIKKLWKEYIGLYSQDGEFKEEVLYNNKMLSIQKHISSYSKEKLQRIDDYDILYSTLKRTNSMGFLPHPIAEKENKLKLIKKFKPMIDVCLIYRSDRYSSKGFKTLTQQIKTLDFISKHNI